jgi:transcription-repair coupling factor (superfamily II helicase)
VFPPSAPLPVRIELFGDEIDSLRAFDPTDQRTVGPLEEAVLLPASEFLQPHGGVAALRDALGRRAGKLPERLAADFERFAGSGPESRALNVGDAAEVWAPLLAPASGLDHVADDTLLVVDEPGDVAEAASSCGARPTSAAPS